MSKPDNITYCANIACPFKDCENHLKNAKRNGGLSMAWLDATCRRYIGWLVDKAKDER